MNLRATGDKLIVKLEEVKSNSTIVLVSNDSETKTGNVLSVGPDIEEINAGERVLFGKFSGTEIQENIFVLKACDILAIEEVA